jgi:hypothetical protein
MKATGAALVRRRDRRGRSHEDLTGFSNKSYNKAGIYMEHLYASYNRYFLEETFSPGED